MEDDAPHFCPRFCMAATRRVVVGAVDRNVGVLPSKTHGAIWCTKNPNSMKDLKEVKDCSAENYAVPEDKIQLYAFLIH